jgi:hypothetical protein
MERGCAAKAIRYMSLVRVRMPLFAALAACSVLVSCKDRHAEKNQLEREPIATAAIVSDEQMYKEWPLHGLITGAQLVIRNKPAPDALTLGWLRRGAIVRMKGAAEKTSTCKSGWYPIYPIGFACSGEGISVSDKKPEIAQEDRAEANREQAMPYQYYMVKDVKVPEYHQLPSRDQQRSSRDYVDAWQKVEAEGNAQKLARFREGKLPGQPLPNAGIRRFLDRGFYVAGTGVTVRSQRRFVQTVRGSFLKEQQLEPRSAPSFQGVELDAQNTLPVAWAVRTALPEHAKLREDGTVKFIDVSEAKPFERLSRVSNRKGWARVGNTLLHELDDGTYLKPWYLAIAEKIAKPKEVRGDEPWVHVDLSQQTLVLYLGDEPRYATLVSSGVPDHATPTGTFRIQRKYVSDTMSDIGADVADDRYSIDDVPWTQYFDGSRALHGAFWHSQFGIQRSHGCINLSPPDARYVFMHTSPALAPGWHGISTQKTPFAGSLVLVTE